MTFNTFTPQTKVLSAKFNENFSKIADGSEVSTTAFDDFVPNIAVVDGTPPTYTTAFTSKYKQIGKFVAVLIDWRNISGGVAGAGTNQITFSPPVEAANVGSTILAGISLNSPTEKRIIITVNSSTSFGLYEATLNNLIGDEQNNDIRAIQLNFMYEAA